MYRNNEISIYCYILLRHYRITDYSNDTLTPYIDISNNMTVLDAITTITNFIYVKYRYDDMLMYSYDVLKISIYHNGIIHISNMYRHCHNIVTVS